MTRDGFSVGCSVSYNHPLWLSVNLESKGCLELCEFMESKGCSVGPRERVWCRTFHKLYLSYFAGCPSGVLPQLQMSNTSSSARKQQKAGSSPIEVAPLWRGAGSWEDPAKKPSLSTGSLAHRKTHTWGPDVHVPVRVPQLIRLWSKTKTWLLITERR